MRLPGLACAKVTCVSDKSKAPAKPEKGSRRRRVGVLALVVLGALCIFISTLSIWIRDVALDEDEWANTSAQLLQSEDVRNVLSVYIVDQAYTASDAEARLEAALPEQLKPLAGPISAQLRGVAYDAVARALARPRVQELWRTANRALNAQLVDLLEGNTERLQLTNGNVVLNLDQIVTDVTGAIGAGEGAAGALQGRIEPITILQVRSAEHSPEDRQVAEGALVLAVRPRRRPVGGRGLLARPAPAADDSQHRLEPGDHRAPHPRHPQGRGQCGHRQPRRRRSR